MRLHKIPILFLDKTFYIGDDKRDIEAAYNANTYIIYVGKKLLTKSEKVKYKFTILNKKILNLYNEKIRFNFKKKIASTKTPLRISFSGGGTDMPYFYKNIQV